MWESRWPSWAVRPNEPSGFLGRKAISNHASALVSACPLYVNRHPRTLSNTTYLPATGRTTMLRSWGPRAPVRSNLCTLLISVSTTVRSKVTKTVSEKQLLRNNWRKGLSNSLCEPSSTSRLLISPGLYGPGGVRRGRLLCLNYIDTSGKSCDSTGARLYGRPSLGLHQWRGRNGVGGWGGSVTWWEGGTSVTWRGGPAAWATACLPYHPWPGAACALERTPQRRCKGLSQ